MERDDLVLPSGFRFHPTDDELVYDYLVRKCRGLPLPSSVISGIDLSKYNPWQLPGMATYGEKEWYFFSPRDRKYPNGERPNRAAGNGYWKATGADRPIGRPRTVAIKKSLVFYAGKQQDGIKTNWIMHEYRLANVDRSSKGKKNKLRLDEWVLCRLYNKKGYIEKYTLTEQSDLESSQGVEEENPEVSLGIGLQLYPKPSNSWPGNSEAHVVETLGSVHKLHPESSSSVHMNSPEFNAADKEVQSEPKRDDLERDLEKGFDYSTLGFMGDADFFGAQSHIQMSQFYPHTQLQMNQFPPLPQQDLFSFPYPNTQQKPF